MPTHSKKPDKYVKQVLARLRTTYQASHPQACIDAYRYNWGSIRVRIIDPDFTGLTPAEREKLIREVLDTLPEDPREEIHVLLLLTPEEAKTSLMNQEFEAPTPTRL